MSAVQASGFQLASPRVHTDRLLFEAEQRVRVELGLPGVSIHTTFDGSDPTPGSPHYAGPLTIRQSGTLKVRAFHEDWRASEVVERTFFRVRHRWRNAALTDPPDPEYPGRGARTLMELEGGGTDFRDGSWLGFREHDLQAVLELERTVDIGELVVSCLIDHASWIFGPAGVRVEASGDGERFSHAAERSFEPPTTAEEAGQRFLRVPVNRAGVRFLRVTVARLDVLPDWHPGAGDRPWLFVDAMAVV